MSTVSAIDKTRPSRSVEKSLQKIRFWVQMAFALLCVWIGVEFHYFVKYLESGGESAFMSRPPGVDGFLPISSLMSLYYLILSGNIHPYHPAGLFILLAVVLVSLVFGKSFCSWLCPVGFISEILSDTGSRLMRHSITVPRWLDYPLRSLKYILLGFFSYSIFFLMNEVALKAFLDGPYNLVADIRMYLFFAEISSFALIIIAVLFFLSIIIRNFWCRYLCPYGALLGICSLLSLFKIKRNPADCIDCSRCAKVCPSRIPVDRVRTVISDECTSCLACVDACPVARTLEVRPVVGAKALDKRLVAIGVVGLFMVITGLAMVAGRWQNNVPIDTYLKHQKNIRTYDHINGPRDISRLKQQNTPAVQSDEP